jgi:hypothetical protein
MDNLSKWDLVSALEAANGDSSLAASNLREVMASARPDPEPSSESDTVVDSSSDEDVVEIAPPLWATPRATPRPTPRATPRRLVERVLPADSLHPQRTEVVHFSSEEEEDASASWDWDCDVPTCAPSHPDPFLTPAEEYLIPDEEAELPRAPTSPQDRDQRQSDPIAPDSPDPMAPESPGFLTDED